MQQLDNSGMFRVTECAGTFILTLLRDRYLGIEM